MSPVLVMTLYFLGIMLIAAEAFVIPGFGIPGILGVAAVVWAAVSAWDSLGPLVGSLLGFAALVTAVAFFLWLPKTKVGAALTLKDRIVGTPGYDDEAKRAGVSIGAIGTAVTDLKPSGFALFGDDRIEVRSDGEWIDHGTSIVVADLRDGRVFVESNPLSSVE